jgi:hypothetical protein
MSVEEKHGAQQTHDRINMPTLPVISALCPRIFSSVGIPFMRDPGLRARSSFIFSQNGRVLLL